MRRTIVPLLLVAALHAATAAEQDSAQDLLVISKMAGVCGVMQQMAAFQTSTKMPGGAEFIERFWRTEFARLGKSQEQFFRECEQSIALYAQMWSASEAQKTKK